MQLKHKKRTLDVLDGPEFAKRVINNATDFAILLNNCSSTDTQKWLFKTLGGAEFAKSMIPNANAFGHFLHQLSCNLELIKFVVREFSDAQYTKDFINNTEDLKNVLTRFSEEQHHRVHFHLLVDTNIAKKIIESDLRAVWENNFLETPANRLERIQSTVKVSGKLDFPELLYSLFQQCGSNEVRRLIQYVVTRFRNNSNYTSFFGRMCGGYSRAQKINTAVALACLATCPDTDSKIQLTPDDLGALRQGTLSEIIDGCPELSNLVRKLSVPKTTTAPIPR